MTRKRTARAVAKGAHRRESVTQFKPGQTITINWLETVYHPGHFRIAFTTDRSQLQDPMVTVDSNQISVRAREIKRRLVTQRHVAG